MWEQQNISFLPLVVLLVDRVENVVVAADAAAVAERSALGTLI